jgi:recombination protein RecR
MEYAKTLRLLIDSFRKLPGVGEKTAERYAFAVLEMEEQEVTEFSANIKDAHDKLKKCRICGFITDEEECSICKDMKREKEVICVVQQAKDVIAMEKTQSYYGVYHVLNGVISTSKGILPEDINIASLLPRINEETKEIIIATNLTVEGETTALYLAKVLSSRNVKVTRIAHGLPMGGHLDYADELTIIKAIEGRKTMG